MKKLHLKQNSPEWLEWREPRIGGSSFKDIKPLSTGKKKGIPEGAAGFWKMLAAKLSLTKRDDETDIERGHRLEAQSIITSNERYNLNLVPGSVWVSDDSEDVYISVDAEENVDAPTYAQETKAFDRHKHLNIIYDDIVAKKTTDYNPLNSVPKDNQDQVARYFRVNKSLDKLLWCLVSDRFAFEKMNHYVIEIERAHVADLLEKHAVIEAAALKRAAELEKFLVKELV